MIELLEKPAVQQLRVIGQIRRAVDWDYSDAKLLSLLAHGVLVLPQCPAREMLAELRDAIWGAVELQPVFGEIGGPCRVFHQAAQCLPVDLGGHKHIEEAIRASEAGRRAAHIIGGARVARFLLTGEHPPEHAIDPVDLHLDLGNIDQLALSSTALA